MDEAKNGAVKILDGIRGQIGEAMALLQPLFDENEDVERAERILWMAYESCKLAKTFVRQIGGTENDGQA